MWFITTILSHSRELMPSPSDPCILEIVFGKKNNKVISDERQTLQKNLNILGFLLWEKSRGEACWHANHYVVQKHSRNTKPSRTRNQMGIYLISFPNFKFLFGKGYLQDVGCNSNMAFSSQHVLLLLQGVITAIALCSAYIGKTIITFLWFGGTSSNYIYHQPAILWLQKYGENGYIISFVAMKILFTEL